MDAPVTRNKHEIPALLATLGVSLLLAVAATSAFSPNGQKSVCTLDDQVTITGTCRRVFAYGPPGYGENPLTDKDDTYLEFTLDTPIKVMVEGEKETVTTAQIVILRPQQFPFYRLVDGAPHGLTGSFDVAETGHHHLPFLFVTEATVLR